MTINRLTTKEIEVLNYVNDHQGKKLRLKFNSESIAQQFDLNPLQVDEMLQRFKAEGLIKKRRGQYLWIGELVLEMLGELG